jgi:hypothetical protein
MTRSVNVGCVEAWIAKGDYRNKINAIIGFIPAAGYSVKRASGIGVIN